MPSEWTVSAPQRLDAFLADQNPEVSRSRIQRAIKEGSVEVNGEEVLRPAHRLKPEDAVFLLSAWEESGRGNPVEPVDLSLPVLYEDVDCMVVDKPAGIAVHPGTGMAPGSATILHGIAHLFLERGILFSSENVLVHRLDKETTGCLLVSKTASAHAALQQQFAERGVRKAYLALVSGQPEPAKALIDSPIGRNLTDRTRMSVLRTSVSREAKTGYRTLETTGAVSLLECDLHTGRTHQVRVHASSIGHPILGDPVYGSAASRALSEEYAVSGMCLHAWKIAFISPSKVKEISVAAPLPLSFVRALEAFGIAVP